jgi:tetratricopeptide (TPR) repeat protein
VRTNDGFRLGGSVPTLAEALHARGYATAAFIGGYPLRSSAGLARGFDRYDDDFLKSSARVERPAGEVVDAALDWIESHRGDRWFVWVHLFDPHSPYTPPPPFAAAHAAAPYDGEVAYTDSAVGRLFADIERLGLFSPAIVVVVADHGESLGEHGERTHGTFLYDATVRVPLLIKLPSGGAARVVDTPVETADIAPTLVATAGGVLAGTDGVSLLPALAGDSGDPERPAYAESYYQNVLLGWSPLRAVRTARWKFIEAPRAELYDLSADPGELHNRIAERGTLADGLRRLLPSASAEEVRAEPSAASSDAAERLRGLGYVSGSTSAGAETGAIDPKDRIDVWSAIEDGIDAMDRAPATARDAFSRAVRLDPANGLAIKYLADLSFKAGQFSDAREGYRRAIAAGFRHPDTYVNLAAIAEREGRLDQARAALDDAVRLAPADADAWNRLGLLDARRGAFESARRAFEKAVAAAPERPEAYYNIGLIERQAGHEAAAQARFQEALARNPNYPEARYELGTGLLLAKQPAPALEAYRAALAVRPDYPEALFGAARAALDLGNTAEARRDYERFVKVAPPAYAKQVAAARDMLRQLK